jgi:hypothetical protein
VNIICNYLDHCGSFIKKKSRASQPPLIHEHHQPTSYPELIQRQSLATCFKCTQTDGKRRWPLGRHGLFLLSLDNNFCVYSREKKIIIRLQIAYLPGVSDIIDSCLYRLGLATTCAYILHSRCNIISAYALISSKAN